MIKVILVLATVTSLTVMAKGPIDLFTDMSADLAIKRECPENSEPITESNGPMVSEFCYNLEESKKVGIEKRYRMIGGKKRYFYYNDREDDQKPTIATYNRQGKMQKIAKGDDTVHLQYNDEGELIEMISHGFRGKDKKTTIFNQDEGVNVEGCDGAQVNESTQRIPCPDGRVFVLDNDSLDSSSRHIKEEIEENENGAAEEDNSSISK